jgi:hypothetical protein
VQIVVIVLAVEALLGPRPGIVLLQNVAGFVVNVRQANDGGNGREARAAPGPSIDVAIAP